MPVQRVSPFNAERMNTFLKLELLYKPGWVISSGLSN